MPVVKEHAVEPADNVFVILDPDDGAINLDQGLARGVSLLTGLQRRCEEWGKGVRTFYAVFNGGNVVRVFRLDGQVLQLSDSVEDRDIYNGLIVSVVCATMKMALKDSDIFGRVCQEYQFAGSTSTKLDYISLQMDMILGRQRRMRVSYVKNEPFEPMGSVFDNDEKAPWKGTQLSR